MPQGAAGRPGELLETPSIQASSEPFTRAVHASRVTCASHRVHPGSLHSPRNGASALCFLTGPCGPSAVSPPAEPLQSSGPAGPCRAQAGSLSACPPLPHPQGQGLGTHAALLRSRPAAQPKCEHEAQGEADASSVSDPRVPRRPE